MSFGGSHDTVAAHPALLAPGIYIISAPSGSGKTTLVERLLRDVPGLHFSISYTTRPPRGPEQHGKNYYFVGRDEFLKMIDGNELLEWAEVFGNYYGTARRFLEESRGLGADLLLDIDVQGARQVRAKLPAAVSVFILPPSRQELEARLRRRSQDSEEVIQKRLSDARREIRGYEQYDFVLINDRLEHSASCLRAIVEWDRKRRAGSALSASDLAVRQLAESCRTETLRDQVAPILESFQLEARDFKAAPQSGTKS